MHTSVASPRGVRAWPLAAVFLASLVAPPPAAGAVCGNGIGELFEEECDDGAQNGLDHCCSTTCKLVDHDGDGVCDAYDHCDTVFGFVADGSVPRPRLRASRLNLTPADARLRFTGVATMPAIPFDPAGDGLGVSFRGPFYYSDFLDVVLPGGDAWTTSSRSWTYRDPTGSQAGIVSVRILRRADGLLSWRIDGRHMPLALTPDDLPFNGQLRVTLTVAPGASPSGAGCGEVYWPTLLIDPQCAFDRTGHAARCGGPAPELACSPGDPDQMVDCGVHSAARAQGIFYSMHGTYFTGLCDALPGFDPLPGLQCTTIGGPAAFSAIAWHPQMTYVAGCHWTSNPLPGKPNYSCEVGQY